MFEKRQGIVVWLHTLKQLKMLRKFGNVHYVSKRLKYVVLYCNMDVVEQTIQKLSSYSFVKHVEPSYKPFLKLEFESKVDKAKEYDYKIGL
ncbi:MAG TPA: YlbG family protein [Metabacillus sp.]|nr:YlbG family protein [Metabacillus sp.]